MRLFIFLQAVEWVQAFRIRDNKGQWRVTTLAVNAMYPCTKNQPKFHNSFVMTTVRGIRHKVDAPSKISTSFHITDFNRS